MIAKITVARIKTVRGSLPLIRVVKIKAVRGHVPLIRVVKNKNERFCKLLKGFISASSRQAFRSDETGARRRSVSVGIALALIIPLTLPGRAGLGQTGAAAKSPTAGQTTGAAKPSAVGQPFTQTLPGSVVKIEMAAIPAGSVTIAGKKVAIKPFWIATTETTWEAMDVFTASGSPSVAYDQTQYAPDAIARPSRSYIPPDLGWGHHGYPAINVSFLNATMFCRWLAKATGKKYRLPTEAEWEYACRAGASAAAKPTADQLEKTAWYADNSKGRTHPVGKKLPNAWKLYDMEGNAGEWAIDMADKPVLCGSAWSDPLAHCTPTERKYQTPAWQATDPQLPKSRWWLADGNFVGFRIICEP